ncbi:NUDIX hydrolase [Glaciihabitans sp. dw_435]|uniref:NUDIX hydrolase n=1 Tax=Glaciihabitans sp. dw_435 TaxID=2720081 RepID=UPI001BD571AD|nr:NUDIX hydrolase [Glaciihabitans sp. dw_435]
MTSLDASLTELHWTTTGSREVYRGRVVVTEHDVVLPGGGTSTFEVDESIPFAVAVLIVDELSRLCLTRQYRYAIDRWIYDLPGGAGDADERPVDAAFRECREEIGLIPVSLDPLHTFFPNPGRVAWPAHIFFCRATSVGVADTSDPAEQVTAVWITLEELDRLIASGDIVDPAVLIARVMAAARGLLPAVVEAG